MEKMQNLRPAHAGKQIFVAARKANHLMRKNRPHDNHLVVVENQPVDFHRHIHRKKAAGKPRNVGGGNGADFFQRRRVIPRVIVKLDPRVGRAALRRGNFQPPADRLFAHRRMCAESDEHVERAGHRSDLPVKRLKQKPDRRGARSIRHYKQDLFAAILLRRAGLGQNISHLFGAQGAARRGRL